MGLNHAPVTLALALASGLIAQAAALHLKVPGLVLLLAVGVVLGPDVANVVRPELLGDSLHTLVGFAVAVILFEGGLGLHIKGLRREQRAIRQLVTVGALVSALGGTLAARFALGWSWRLSALFGTLVIVTGPTVVTPLLRRLKVKRAVSTILEAEGVLIDAVGAIIAAVALEIALRPTGERAAVAVLDIVARLGLGATMGAIGGLAIALPLRIRGLVPEGLENVFTLGLVLAIFQLSNAVLHESGIAAVIVAGIVVRNANTHVERELREFKEQLTVMLIGMLFVLLAADVRLADVMALGVPGVVVVAAVIVVVRPANVLVGTWRTSLDWRQRLFLAWIGPRGIVAAAVASLFVGQLEAAGIPGGRALRALVFLVITATVVFSGLTGGIVAAMLNLRRKRDSGWVILGAGRLARMVARLLTAGSDEVVCIESNPRAVREAEADGVRVVFGNGLESRTRKLAEIETRAGVLGMTPNEDTNALFLQRAKRQAPHLRLCAVLESWDSGVTAPMLEKMGADVLFGGSGDIERWGRYLEAGDAKVEWWRLVDERADGVLTSDEGNPPYLPLVVRQGKLTVVVSHTWPLREGDEVAFLMHTPRLDAARERVRAAGFVPSSEAPHDGEDEPNQRLAS